MNILLVDQLGKTTGRATLSLAELINKDKNTNVYVYLSNVTEIPKDKIYTVTIEKGFEGSYEGNFYQKGINYLKALKKLRTYIIKKNIDVVYLQWFSLPWIEWIYIKLLKKYCKVTIMIHDVIPFNNRPLEMKYLDKIYNNADLLFIHTKIAKEEFKQNYTSTTPILITGQAFSDKNDYNKVNKNIAREHLNIPKDKIVFLFYGTIREAKGLDILIQAFHEAYKENKHIFLVIAGAFNKVNEEKYKSLVRNLLTNENSFINFSFIPEAQEKYYLSAVDVLCLPYRRLTQSGIAQIGLMYDLPMIATDVGAMKEVVRDKENGLIFKVDDIKNCKQALLQMADDENIRKTYANKSYELSINEFSLAQKAQIILKECTNLMNNNNLVEKD